MGLSSSLVFLFVFLFVFLSLSSSLSPPSSLHSNLPSLSEDQIQFLLSVSQAQQESRKEERERRLLWKDGDESGYQWKSWMYGPPCPNRTLVAVPFEDVAENANVKRSLREIHADGVSYIEEMKLLGFDVGLSLVVVYDQEILYSEGFGVKDVTTRETPDLDTIFDIGSVTKIFTSALFLKMKEEGFVTLDDDLTSFFNDSAPPAWNVRNPYKSPNDPRAGVSLHSLAMQSSGVGREAPCGIYCGPSFGEDLNFQYLNAYYSIMWPPYSQAHYSNLGFTLLGRSLERAKGGVYETLLVDEVLAPLEMNSSGFTFTSNVISRMATGYTVNASNKQVTSAYSTTECGFSAPAAGMYSSPRDIATFLSFLFRDAPLKKPGEGLDVIQEYLVAGRYEPDGVSAYGLAGWETVYDEGRWILTKGGLMDGFASSIAFDPYLKVGVGAFINFPNGAGADALTTDMINELIPSVTAAVTSSQPVFPLPANYQQMTGSYANIIIMREGPHLSQGFLDGSIVLFPSPVVYYWDPSQDFELSGVHYTAFRYRTVDDKSSCFLQEGLGSEAIVFFTTLRKPAVTWPDEHIFNLPRSGN